MTSPRGAIKNLEFGIRNSLSRCRAGWWHGSRDHEFLIQNSKFLISHGGAMVIVERPDPSVARLVLDQPARFNPLSSAMIAALEDALRRIAADAEVRAVVLAANGRGFCAGHDLKEMRAHAHDRVWQRQLFDA